LWIVVPAIALVSDVSSITPSVDIGDVILVVDVFVVDVDVAVSPIAIAPVAAGPGT
jgi:hypothetical protein